MVAYPEDIELLDILARVAPYYDINSAADLWLVPTSLLCRWARIIIAHDACTDSHTPSDAAAHDACTNSHTPGRGRQHD